MYTNDIYLNIIVKVTKWNFLTTKENTKSLEERAEKDKKFKDI